MHGKLLRYIWELNDGYRAVEKIDITIWPSGGERVFSPASHCFVEGECPTECMLPLLPEMTFKATPN